MEIFTNLLFSQFYISLLAFIPAIINLFLFIYIYYYFQKTKLSLVLSQILIFACIWQVGQGLMIMSNNEIFAERLYSFINSCALIVTTGCLYFSLLLSQTITKKNNSIIVTLIYLPTFFFVLINILGLNNIHLKYDNYYGYIDNTDNIIYHLNLIFISIVGLLTVFFFLKEWISTKNELHRKQVSIITIGFLIPFFQGLISEIIFPLILHIDPIPLTTTSITFFSIAALIALKKHDLLSFSPYKVSDNILGLMSDAVLISDNEGIVKYLNPALAKMLKYSEDELIGKQGYFMLADETSKQMVANMIPERKEGKTNSYEVNMKTKDGVVLNVIINAAPYYINNQIMGALVVIHNITSEKKKIRQLKEAMIIGEEKERFRLSKELHDGIAQNIAVIKMNLQAIEFDSLSPEDKIIFDDISKLTKDTLQEIRDISHNLNPLKDGELLCEAITRLISNNKNSGIQFNFNLTGGTPKSIVNNLITINLYRILQEFINNTIKYAEANLITINLNYLPNQIEVEIKDDGQGFDHYDKNINYGIGLLNMQQRTKIIDGTFDYSSEKKLGTSLKIVVPI